MNGMNLIELGKLVSDEKKSLQYLCKKLEYLSCPSCDRKEFYFMTRQRIRCARCGYDFRPLNGTGFSTIKISASKWLSLIKLFELSVSARRASVEAKLSYNTALRAFDIIRLSILHDSIVHGAELEGEIELDESYFGGKRKGNRGRGAAGKTIVFGILERGGKVSVDIVKDVSAATLMNETVKKVRRGSIVYTDKWRSYDS